LNGCPGCGGPCNIKAPLNVSAFIGVEINSGYSIRGIDPVQRTLSRSWTYARKSQRWSIVTLTVSAMARETMAQT
jgi:hypothetical protein